MKILIVDDEKPVRNSIRRLIEWINIDVDLIIEAENGEQAIESIVTRKPQIIITDMMMPVKNGVQLLEWIVSKYASSAMTIVISGYNDFELVRSTLKHGGIDYLLKPINMEQFEAALRKAVDMLKKTEQTHLEQQERTTKLNEFNQMFRDRLLSNLLVAKPTNWQKMMMIQELKELQGARTSIISILSLVLLNKNIREKYDMNIDLLIFTILNICNDVLSKGNRGIAFHNTNSLKEIVFVTTDTTNINKIMLEINQNMARVLNGAFDIGVGTEMLFPQHMNESYHHALQSLLQANLIDRSSRIHVYLQSAPSKHLSLHYDDYADDIRLAVTSGNPENIKYAVQKWFDYLEQLTAITFRQLKMWKVEYSIFISKLMEVALNESEMENRFSETGISLPLDENGVLDLDMFREQITRNLIELSFHLDERAAKSRNNINDILQYIQANYTQEITIQELSEKFHYNRDYISRKFKHVFNDTLINYLNKIRIDKAKVLLTNPNLKVIDIANMVGFQDEKYFSRVFKKLVGQSPKDYKGENAYDDNPL